MPNKSKNKGKAYERVVCKHLTKIFGLNHERVWSSGAFTGGQNIARCERLTKEQLLLSEGDIIVPVELSHVKYECKDHRDFSFSKLFTGSAKLDGWIKQASQSNRLLWLLVFKAAHVGSYVVFDSVWQNIFSIKNNWMVYKNKYIITSLNDFFEDNKDIILNLPTLHTQQIVHATIPLSQRDQSNVN